MKKIKNLLLICFLALSFNTIAQTGPGGVGNATTNSMWLKANQGVVSNNTKVSKWSDCSGNNIVLEQSNTDKQPLVSNTTMNAYPTLNFDKTGSTKYLSTNINPSNLDGTKGITIFSVVKKIANSSDARTIVSKRNNVNDNESFMFFFYNNNKLNIDYQGSYDRFETVDTFLDNKNLLVSSMFDGNLNINSRSTIYEGNTLLKTSKETNDSIPQNVSPVVIGATHVGDNRSFDGLIAEVITYRVALNETQRIIVNNYLSAKYDIQLTDRDLYKMDDPSNGNFDHEVAGIGYLSLTDNHLKAQGSGIVEISNASSLDEKFLFWGHNNATQQAVNTSDLPATVQARFDRVWRLSSVTSSGFPASVGTVSVQFDLTTLGNVDPLDLRLLISSTGSFASTTPIAGAVHVSGNLYRFNGVNLEDANFFTLGTINPVVTPLPIKLLSFSANCVNDGIELNWSTGSEQNNDKFIIEKSRDGKDWIYVDSIKSFGSGNSNTELKYSITDKDVWNSTIYYRLSQVDFNGKTETFTPISIGCDINESNIILYPNPNNGKFVIELSSDKIELDSELIITDILGKILYKDKIDILLGTTNLNFELDLKQGIYNVNINKNKTMKMMVN